MKKINVIIIFGMITLSFLFISLPLPVVATVQEEGSSDDILLVGTPYYLGGVTLDPQNAWGDYSFYIIPFLGKAITGSVQAYTHLPESIRTFPSPDELTDSLKNIGFLHVTHRKLTNGIAVIHLAKKNQT